MFKREKAPKALSGGAVAVSNNEEDIKYSDSYLLLYPLLLASDPRIKKTIIRTKNSSTNI